MLRKTSLSYFMPYADYLVRKKNINNSHDTEATPYIKKTIHRLDVMYSQNLHDKSYEKARKLYIKRYRIGYDFLNNKMNCYNPPTKTVYYVAGTIVVKEEKFKMTEEDYAELTRFYLQKYGCQTYGEFKKLIKDAYDIMFKIAKNHRLLDKFTNELDEYVRLHKDFHIQSSPYDKQIVELTKSKMRLEERLTKTLNKRRKDLIINNPDGS